MRKNIIFGLLKIVIGILAIGSFFIVRANGDTRDWTLTIIASILLAGSGIVDLFSKKKN